MEFTVIHSNRKTIAIQVNMDLSVIVRAPKRASQKEIQRFLKEKEAWVIKAQEKMRKRQEEYEAEPVEVLTEAQLRELAALAAEHIPGRAAYYSRRMGVDYGRITIRNQKTRWGSCSSRGDLNFNCLLMLAPPEVIDYVVVHELCHRIEMNHSQSFWKEVEKILPDYKKRIRWLKTEGGQIMRRRP